MPFTIIRNDTSDGKALELLQTC